MTLLTADSVQGSGGAAVAALVVHDAMAAAQVDRVFAVNEWCDVAIVRHQARRLAREHGLEPRHAGEVAIVVSELASNIVKYGVRGEIALHMGPLDAASGSVLRAAAGGWRATGGVPPLAAAITVVARDVGPPIQDVETAMLDGHDDRGPIDPAALASRGGLGTGLGAVARLADRLEVRQEEAGGKEIIASLARRRQRPT